MPRLRRVAFRVSAVFLGVVIALAASEAVLRVVVHSQATEPKQMAVDVSKTEEGMSRAHLPATPSLGNELYIGFLGDSFTYGLGVAEDKAFPKRTEMLLNQRWPRRCVVINLGVPGEDAIREWCVYDLIKDKARFDVVVQVLSPNDNDVDLYKDMYEMQEAAKRRVWISRYSLVAEVVEQSVRENILRYRMVDYMCGGATSEARERTWRILSYSIGATKRLVESDGAVYALARFPFLPTSGWSRLDEVHDRTAEMARGLGVPFLDLREAFDGNAREELHLPEEDHPSETGHARAAEALADFLISRILPNVSSSASRGARRIRSQEEVVRGIVAYYEGVLRLDPTCRSAALSLLQYRKDRPANGAGS
ncbi:MAG: SGNH/GDSL hydrolase family protein [Phycisphaerae bacterium]|nr:SGNH/GDSL hydrolase family protein [Phycisphaerae bacterium]